MSRAAFVLVTALFFLWGFLTSLNNILVPHFKEVFELGFGGSALVQLAFYSAYFLLSLPSGAVLARVGYQRGIVLGLAVSALGALLFYPAASIPSYPFFLAGLFVLAAGITLIQVAANPYVTALGPPETAASRLNLTQAFNSLGTTLAPYLGGLVILSATVRPDKLAAAQVVRGPYVAIAAVLVVLALVFARARLPVIATEEGGGARRRTFREALRVRRLGLGVLAIFAYVGAEVTIGSFLVDLFALPDVAGLRAEAAATYVSMYWGGAMIGRFIGAAALRVRDAGMALGGCAVAAATLVIAAVASHGAAAALTLVAVGLCNGIMFPTIFSLAIDGLGELTSRGSSLLVMACVGGAVLPVVVGAVADRVGLQTAFAVVVPGYLYIAWYGYRGSRHAR